MSAQRNKKHCPQYLPPDGKSQKEYLIELCQKGVKERLGKSTSEIQGRIEKEIKISEQTGNLSYFLIMWDLAEYMKKNYIPRGPGRGALPGSLIAYVLGITDVNPLEYNLIFERLLNPVKNAQLDIEFNVGMYVEVIVGYIKKKYEPEKVARMAMHTTSPKILISNIPLKECNIHVLENQWGDNIIHGNDFHLLEEMGCIRIALFVSKLITVVNDTIKIINQSGKGALSLSHIKLDDEKTFSLISRAETIGVFQLESSGMLNLARKLKPDCFEDIIHLVSLFTLRPMHGGMVDDFIERRHSKRPIKYDHPILEPILKETYGVMLYQEQIMKIANEIAGFSMSEADSLRRILGKRGANATHKKTFILGAKKKGIKKEIASKVFDLIACFTSYGFNKAHSVAYAMITYQTAYLKANYPDEYMFVLLEHSKDDEERGIFLSECRRMKLKGLHLPKDNTWRTA